MQKSSNASRWVSVAALAMAYGAIYNPCYIRYILYDAMQASLQCTNTELAFLNSLCALAAIFLCMPGGWIADRCKPKNIIFWSALGNLPLCLISAMFSTVYWVQILVWLGFCLTGCFSFWPAVIKAVRLTSTADQQNTTFGIFEGLQGGVGMLGNFIAIGLFSMFVDQVAGWKAAMISMGIYSAIGALLVKFCYKQQTLTDDTQDSEGEEKKKFSIKDTLLILKSPGTWLVTFVIIGAYGTYLSQPYFTPFFTSVLGATVIFSAAMSNFRSYGMKIIGGPLGGFCANKLKSASKLNALCLIVCFGLIFYVSRLKPGSDNVVALATVVTMLLALVCLMAKGTMWATMEEAHIPRHLCGTAVAVISYLAFYLLEFAIPFVNGYWLDKYADNLAKAYSNFFTLNLSMMALGTVSAICLVIYDRNRKKRQKDLEIKE